MILFIGAAIMAMVIFGLCVVVNNIDHLNQGPWSLLILVFLCIYTGFLLGGMDICKDDQWEQYLVKEGYATYALVEYPSKDQTNTKPYGPSVAPKRIFQMKEITK